MLFRIYLAEGEFETEQNDVRGVILAYADEKGLLGLADDYFNHKLTNAKLIRLFYAIEQQAIVQFESAQEKQKLVDIMFEVAMAYSHSAVSNEQVAGYVARQLSERGFKTKPQGSSWGVLQD